MTLFASTVPDMERSSAEIYAAEVMPQIRRLLGLLDREPDSVTAGSFDRDHWSWKFRDFPLGMLQVGMYPLALLWRHELPDNPYYQNPRVLAWLEQALSATVGRQHKNGAIDAFTPNEQNPGPTLGIAHGLAETLRLLRGSLAPEREQRIVAAIERACEFALRRDEDHGFVSNHWGLFAVAFLDGYELTGRPEFLQRAQELVARILQEQSTDGWFNEYGGPDPGYESLGIFHLSVYWQRTGDPAVLAALKRSIGFYAHCIHPDGSVGGTYGSRHTALYFPGGFEILASEVPEAAAVAEFMRARLRQGNVVTPATVDTENLPPLIYTYLEAARAAPAVPPPAPPLPCEVLAEVVTFADAGIAVAGTQHYYAIVHGKKGGACRIFDRQTMRIAYEDAGYLVCEKGEWWTSQVSGGTGRLERRGGNEVACTSQLVVARQEQLTPVRFLVLRILNLTLFRSLTLGNAVRRLIVRRLITGRRPGPFRLRRAVEFAEQQILFRDELVAEGGVSVERVSLPRSYSSIHMGSAKYFQASELVVTPEVDVESMAEQLTRKGRAAVTFALGFPEVELRQEVVELEKQS